MTTNVSPNISPIRKYDSPSPTFKEPKRKSGGTFNSTSSSYVCVPPPRIRCIHFFNSGFCFFFTLVLITLFMHSAFLLFFSTRVSLLESQQLYDSRMSTVKVIQRNLLQVVYEIEKMSLGLEGNTKTLLQLLINEDDESFVDALRIVMLHYRSYTKPLGLFDPKLLYSGFYPYNVDTKTTLSTAVETGMFAWSPSNKVEEYALNMDYYDVNTHNYPLPLNKSDYVYNKTVRNQLSKEFFDHILSYTYIWSIFCIIETDPVVLLPYLSFHLTGNKIRTFYANNNTKYVDHIPIIWTGASTVELSSFLSHKDSNVNDVSFLVSLSTLELIGVSGNTQELFVKKEVDVESGELVCNFLKPQDHTNDAVRTVSLYLFNNKTSNYYLEKIYGLGINDVYEIEIVGYSVIIMKINGSIHGADMVLISTTPSYIATVNLLLKTIVSLFLCVFSVVFLSIGWISIIMKVFCEYREISKKLGMIKEMDFDDFEKENCCLFFSFIESRFVIKRLIEVKRKLLRYKSFLPQNIVTPVKRSTSCDIDTLSSDDSFCSDYEGGENKFSLGLSSMHIYLLVIHFSSFSLENFFHKLFIIVSKHSIIHDFDNKKVVLLYTDSKSQILNHIEKIRKENWDGIVEDMKIFIASGNVDCGNVGSQTIKKFIIVGDIFDVIERMKKRVPHFINVCCNDQFVDEIGLEKCMFRRIDFRRKPMVFEVGWKKNVQQNEWMYEVSELEKFASWDMYSQSMMLFEKGHKFVKDGIEKLEEFLKEYPEDELAKMIYKRMTSNMRTK